MGKEYRLSNGKILTEEMIEEHVREAERGFDVDKLLWNMEKERERGRPPLGDGPSTVLPVRLDPALEAALAARVADTGKSRSELTREALRSFLDAA